MGWELNNLDKIHAGDDKTRAGRSNSKIIEALREVSPEVFTDGKVDFELLKFALGEEINESEERYGLSWNGKRKSMLITRFPSTGTLRVVDDEALEPESSTNCIIVGDNLEVLKLLQKSYTSKVKMIYIDPPYNKDGDYIYPDNFEDSIDNYLQITSQVDDKGRKISTKVETTGRFHSKWLSMMYPRLWLSRQLLQDDGIIFISIGPDEVANLIHICNEIFGESQRVGVISRLAKSGGNKGKFFSPNVEYVLVYASNSEEAKGFRKKLDEELIKKVYTKTQEDGPREGEKYRQMGLYQSSLDARQNQRYWIQAPDGTFVIPPGNVFPEAKKEGEKITPATNDDGVWRWTYGRYLDEKEKGNIVFNATRNDVLLNEDGEFSKWNVDTKIWLKERQDAGQLPTDLIIEDISTDLITAYENRHSAAELKQYQIPFTFAKPVSLINYFLEIISIENNDIIMDFFAGSGTTGDAVLQYNLNNKDSDLRYVLIQIPEALDPNNKNQKAASDFLDSINKPRDISEITKERMRRVAAKIREGNPDYKGDLGFKVFTLDSSNIKEWDVRSENLQKSLEEYINQIKDGRTSLDILYEVMLKSGIELTADIEEVEVGNNKVLSVHNCRLLACLDKEIKSDVVAEIASAMVELKNANTDTECMVLFLDGAFADLSGKLNMSETLKQNGFDNIRSI